MTTSKKIRSTFPDGHPRSGKDANGKPHKEKAPAK